MSPNLRREIKSITDNDSKSQVTFHNGSCITVVICNQNARGHRSTVNVGEEARELNKKLMDEIISPFKINRSLPFMTLPQYETHLELLEDPQEIYISSSVEETHWLFKTAKQAALGMMKNTEDACFFALDYSICLKHNIKSKRTLMGDKAKTDPVTWMIEYENAVLRSNSDAYFPYDLVKDCCVLKKAFYPSRVIDNGTGELNIKKPICSPKQYGEIRIVAADIASIEKKGNDNSCYSLLRLFPESIELDDGKINDEIKIQVPYLEAYPGRELKKQAIRIRQLYHDFDADYIVLDVRNSGVGVYDCLARVLYDEERDIEYSPLTSMNDEAYKKRIIVPNAEERIFCISASTRLNNDMVINLKTLMSEHKIEFLVHKDDAVDVLMQMNPRALINQNVEEQLWFEHPYVETMSLRKELIDLVYVKSQNTGLIRVYEPNTGVKDRFSSVEMGAWFAHLVNLDLYNEVENEITDYTSCVSAIS